MGPYLLFPCMVLMRSKRDREKMAEQLCSDSSEKTKCAKKGKQAKRNGMLGMIRRTKEWRHRITVIDAYAITTKANKEFDGKIVTSKVKFY